MRTANKTTNKNKIPIQHLFWPNSNMKMSLKSNKSTGQSYVNVELVYNGLIWFTVTIKPESIQMYCISILNSVSFIIWFTFDVIGRVLFIVNLVYHCTIRWLYKENKRHVRILLTLSWTAAALVSQILHFAQSNLFHLSHNFPWLSFLETQFKVILRQSKGFKPSLWIKLRVL